MRLAAFRAPPSVLRWRASGEDRPRRACPGSAPVPLIASRLNRIQRSASSVQTQRAREMKAAGQNVIALSSGEPDFDTPDNVKRAAVKAIERGETKYTNNDGTTELKQA